MVYLDDSESESRELEEPLTAPTQEVARTARHRQVLAVMVTTALACFISWQIAAKCAGLLRISIIWMLLALFGRSGLFGFFTSACGLDGACGLGGVAELSKEDSHGSELKDFQTVLGGNLEAKTVQVFFLCFATFLFWHASQVAFFLIAWDAYRERMGLWQWMFATGVAFKEVFYLGISLVAAFQCPQYLLFAPFRRFSSQEPWVWLLHLLAPDVYVLLVLHTALCKTSWGALLEILGVVNPLGGACAMLALGCGIFGEGVMSLPLGVGYMLTIAGAFTMLFAAPAYV